MWLPCGSSITMRVFESNSASLSWGLMVTAPKMRRDFDFLQLAVAALLRCAATLYALPIAGLDSLSLQ